MIVPHQLRITKAQMKKLQQGQPIQISFASMGADKGDAVIGLKEANAKKLMSAFKRGKGLRMIMDADELDYTMKSGGSILGSIRSAGRSAGNYAKRQASQVKDGFNLGIDKIVDAGNRVAKPVKQVLGGLSTEQRSQMKNFAMGLVREYAAGLAQMVDDEIDDEDFAKDLEEAIVDIADELLSGDRIVVGSKIIPLFKQAVKIAADRIEDPQTQAVVKAILKKGGMGLYARSGSGMKLIPTINRATKFVSGKGVRKSLVPVRNDGQIHDARYREPPLSRKGSGNKGLRPLNPSREGGKPLMKGSQEMRDKMAMVRAGKSGKGLGKVLRQGKKAVFGKRIADEMNILLPIAGGVAGGATGALLGPKGAVLGSALGTRLGQMGASKIAKKGLGLSGMGLRGQGEMPSRMGRKPAIKPASDVMTLSPYTSINAPAFNPFYPKSSFQNGGSGENQ